MCKKNIGWPATVEKQRTFQIDLIKLQEDFEMMDDDDLLASSSEGDAIFEIDDTQGWSFNPDIAFPWAKLSR